MQGERVLQAFFHPAGGVGFYQRLTYVGRATYILAEIEPGERHRTLRHPVRYLFGAGALQ